LGAGKPLAHHLSPKQLLGSGACGLLEIFLKQQVCYWTGVLCTGRQLADARLETAEEETKTNESSFLEAGCSCPHSFDRNTLCKFCAQIEKKGQALAQAKRVT
jgi:hypothetical protein